MSIAMLVTMLLCFALSISVAVSIGLAAFVGVAGFTELPWLAIPKEMFTAIDKFPLVVKSVPGFLVNRVLAPYMRSAMQRLQAGEEKEKIDEAARTFGMPMGPIELADAVGWGR